MSRTYHHGYKWAHRTKDRCHHLLYDGQSWRTGETFVGIATWNEPKWWRRYFKHRKRRAQTRNKCRQIMKGHDPENMVWPRDKQPWIYYW
jgi:hypothetical protein